MILIFTTFACDVPEKPAVITVTKEKSFRPSNPQEVQTVEQAFAAIITVARDDLHLPVVDPLYVHLYKNTASFASYGFKSWVSRSLVSHIRGTADGNKININLAGMRTEPWGASIWDLSHEYGHNIDNEISNVRVYRSSWFAEGFAEWVAANIVDRLRWQDYELTLRRLRLELAANDEPFPKLSNLSSPEDWYAYARRPKGGLMAYTLAFNAVDRLIRKHGISSAVQFIRSGDFEASFGEPATNYEVDSSDFHRGYTGIGTTESISILRPDWKVGNRWTYDRKTLGKNTQIVKQVIKEDLVQGKFVFIVTDDDEEDTFTKDTLNLISTSKHQKLITSRKPANRFFAWPLESRKRWENQYVFTNFETGETSRVDRNQVVAAIEEITVPAGTFLAAKIESYDKLTGRLVAEYWYAPAAKWFVRSILYGASDGFPRIEELSSVNVESR